MYDLLDDGHVMALQIKTASSAAEARNATFPRVGEVLSNSMKERITDLKSDHPELGALADRMETMNATQVTAELSTILDFGHTVMNAVKNMQGNTTAATQ